MAAFRFDGPTTIAQRRCKAATQAVAAYLSHPAGVPPYEAQVAETSSQVLAELLVVEAEFE